MESKDQSLRILLLMWINFQKLVSAKMLTSKTCDVLDIKNMKVAICIANVLWVLAVSK
jgi:hypothetical protein